MKKKVSNWYRLLAGLIILAGAFTLIAAGGRDSGSSAMAASAAAENVNPPGVYPICKTPITINVGLVPNATVESYTDNALTKYWEEKGNFKLVFENFTPSDARDKLSVMVNSGTTLPEVLVGFGLSEITVLQYGSQGAILPLNKYIDSLGVHFREAIQRLTDKDLVKYITSADGNIYYLPGYQEQVGNMWSMRQFINQSWLDKLGLQMPKTTDEFYTVLKAFKEKDPNGNGIADEIPMLGSRAWRSSSADALMNAFTYNPADGTDGSRLVIINGKIDVPYNKPEWKDGLIYINKLVSERLLDPTSFTNDEATFRQLAAAGDVSTVGFFNGGVIPLPAGNPRLLEYVAFPPLTGPKGVRYSTYFPIIPATSFMITKDAKNVEAIFRWGDLMMTEESSLWGRWGIPGVDWGPPQPGDEALYAGLGFKASIRTIMPLGSNQKSHWGWNHAYVNAMGTAEGVVLVENNPLLIEHWGYSGCAVNVGLAPKDTVPMLKYTVAETDRIKNILPELISYVNESLARFSTGDLNINGADWDRYLAELDRIGVKTFLDAAQTAYTRMMK